MSRLAIYHPPGRLGLPNNPFGKDVANLQLFQALVRHGGFERIDLLTHGATDEAAARETLLDGYAGAEIGVATIMATQVLSAAGAVLRGQPYLHELAWQRRRNGAESHYSLIGLIHTLAPMAVREMIAASVAAPVQPWDAIVCTSPSVHEATVQMLSQQGEWLAERTGGRPPALPHLPIIPLGVEADRFAAIADRADAGAALRRELGLAADDILVLWVGRLSFFEKAFPQPMLRAVSLAAEQTGARVVFAMAGWFPDPKDQAAYEEAVAAHAFGIEVRFEDGNDKARLADLWAAADIFLSLVDNIQETFGITPLEAMAAGLPLVVSDWDGYRFTVRDGSEGFLIPTLGGPASGGLGGVLSARLSLEIDSYQVYAGAVAQHTAVHIGRCAAALSDLIRSKDLRRRMGAAGRARVRDAFDWPVVARQFAELVAELAAIRAGASSTTTSRRGNPAKGDPFQDFAHFATDSLALDMRLTVTPDLTVEDVAALETRRLDMIFGGLRASPQSAALAFERVARQPGLTLRELLTTFPTAERRGVEMSVAWLAKYGFLDWLA